MKRIQPYPALFLALAAAWSVGFLFRLGSGLPPSLWTTAVLAAELWIFQRRPGIKAVCGGVFCVSLAFALLFGLASALSYAASYLRNEVVLTSFPWYSGFAFAAMVAGPVLLASGIAWTVLHLRQHPGNIRDIRLLTGLLLGGTAAWAILWTVLRLCHAEPPHTALLRAAARFGPWLLAEGTALALLGRRQLPGKPAPAPERPPVTPLPWGKLGLGAAALLLATLLADPGHEIHNALTVSANAMTVCLALLLAALIPGKPVPGWLAMGLTALAAAVWSLCHGSRCGLSAGGVAALALVFFGPFLLGGGMFVVLGRRFRRERLSPAALLAALLLAGVLAQTAYVQDVSAAVTVADSGEDDALRLSVRPDGPVDGIFDWQQHQEGDSLYLTYSTRWTPFAAYGPFQFYDNLRPGGDVTRIFVCRGPGRWELALVRDPVTGAWTAAE